MGIHNESWILDIKSRYSWLDYNVLVYDKDENYLFVFVGIKDFILP